MVLSNLFERQPAPFSFNRLSPVLQYTYLYYLLFLFNFIFNLSL